MNCVTSPPKTLLSSERGSTLLAAILVALLASALSSFFLSDTLAEAHMAMTKLESEATLRTAQSMLHLALQQLKSALAGTNATNWDAILPGPDGVFEPCGRADWNPVRPEDAARSIPGSLCNTCGDDGTLSGSLASIPVVGKAGLLILQSSTGAQQLIPLPATQLCGGNPLTPTTANSQAWFKVRDNPELDGDPNHDSDGVAVLRVVVARRGPPSATGRTAGLGLLNTVVVLEAWLRIAGNSTLQVVAIREVPY